ncbi:hypothetical protein NIES4071_13310 [Calothrix sp. NIES-4071]|nr:hypothetical protein NIES4071_13310 [Calothrix sp. NIES-4071]BAZ55671.1 hypothetical protein NIES4105_13270 [Calothrix sp. NIES-4105]
MIIHEIDKEYKSTNMIRHLARLSDCIFAFAMALMVAGFDFPDAKDMTDAQINSFLMGQLKPLGTYVITFVLVAVYWIAHSQQVSYYRRTDETHLWIGVVYLMCLFIVPLSNDLLMSFPKSFMVKVWFSVNIFLIGILSFVSWTYATYNHRLVDLSLDKRVIWSTRVKALIEPVFALVSIAVAFLNQGLWDYVWLVIPIVYFLVERFFKEERTAKVAKVAKVAKQEIQSRVRESHHSLH